MQNVAGVVFTCAGLFLVVAGLFGVRAGMVVGGLGLFLLSAATLVDLDGS